MPEEFKPKYNGYACINCGKKYLSVDLAAGTTPMFMTCMRTEGCGGQAVSMGYPSMKALFGWPLLVEWVIPTDEEIAKVNHEGLLEHFAAGGLMRKAVDTAPNWVKEMM